MKKIHWVASVVLVGIVSVFPAFAQEMQSEEAKEMQSMGQTLKVEQAAICESVVDHEPVQVGTEFPSTIGKLYCFTRIVGAEEPTEVVHVWYFGETERARVKLSVKLPSWRTMSSKIIQAHEVGKWRVDILDAEGNLLSTLPFTITAPMATGQ